jgi:glycosyltransferase involved in cell wall biosynthesis
MKKILLISNYVFHYRINNYNYFYNKFKETGTAFSVLANGAQKVDFDFEVPITIMKFNLFKYIRYINKEKPDCIILFLHLKDMIIFPLIYYCRIKKIPVVYWNFGIDLGDPDHTLKNYLYRHIHCAVNAILLYSPNEYTYIKPKYHFKTFVANNTINMTDLESIKIQGNVLRDVYQVKEKYIVLFVGRIIASKRVDVLLKCFRNEPDIAVVIAGRGITQEMLSIIKTQPNYYYLGEIKYDKIEISKIYHGADVVCIPGNVGLAIVEAFFWGKPLVTLKSIKGLNSPEIFYLKDGENGYIANDEKEMEEKIIHLLGNPELYQQFSKRAKDIIMTEGHISKMFAGFNEVFNYAISAS